MKSSIIIPTRNRFKILCERALPSVMQQGIDFELIIVDDASDEEYGGFMLNSNYYKNEERKGLAWNRNFGAKKAKGDYIVHLDDDNELHPDYLRETVAYLNTHPQYDAVGVGKTVVYPEGKAYQPPPEGEYFSMNDGFLIRREAFLDIKCDPKLTAMEDADFGLRFLKKYKVGRINKPLMTVYASPIINTTSYSDYSDYHLEGLAKFWLKDWKDLPEKDRQAYKKYIGRMFLLSAERPRWFKWFYWLEEKIKRYYRIW